MPDPEKKHYEAICAAVEMLCNQHDLEPSQIYLWIECVVRAGLDPQATSVHRR